MKYLKRFKEITAYDYNITDNPESLSKRDIDMIIQSCEKNSWNWEKRTRDSEFQIEFSKSDYCYTINIERQNDEYYLVHIFFEDYLNPQKDDDKYLLLDGNDDLRYFLENLEKFYNHKRLFSIKSL
jgi:hypothetical protein